MSDSTDTLEDGLLKLLEPGDLALAVRGFRINDFLLKIGAILEIHPSSSGLGQMKKSDMIKTKSVAHIGRAMARMKNLAILRHVLLISMLRLIDGILLVCAVLCNFQNP